MNRIIIFILYIIFLNGVKNLFSQNAEIVFEKNKDAIISIMSFEPVFYNKNANEYSFDTSILWGTGFIVDKAGIAVTCYHVIEFMDSIMIKTNSNSYHGAILYYTDTKNDIAILKIHTDSLTTFSQVTLGNSDEIKKGQPIFVIGNPLGYEYSISQGIISGIRDNERIKFPDKDMTYDKLIQTDAAISPGNSGSAIFNTKGDVIGLISFNYLSLGNLNFAVAVNCIKNVLNEDGNSEYLPESFKNNKSSSEIIRTYLDAANYYKRNLADISGDSSRNNGSGKAVASKSTNSSTSESSELLIRRDSVIKVYYTKAEKLYLKCIEMDSTFLDSYNELIDFYITSKKIEKAEEIYLLAKGISESHGARGSLTNCLLKYYLAVKNFNKIKKMYNIENENKAKPVDLYKLALLFESVNDTINANKLYFKIAQKDTNNFKIFYQIGKIYFLKNNIKQAKMYFNRVQMKKEELLNQKENLQNYVEENDTYSDFMLNYYLALIALKDNQPINALIYYISMKPENPDERNKKEEIFSKVKRIM